MHLATKILGKWVCSSALGYEGDTLGFMVYLLGVPLRAELERNIEGIVNLRVWCIYKSWSSSRV